MAGNDSLNGGTGNDTYVFSEGDDVAFETGGTETILFWEAWDPADIMIYRAKVHGPSAWEYDLVLEDQNGNTLVVDNHFEATGKSAEYVKFYDDTTWDILTMEFDTYGTSSGESLDGGSIGDASEDDAIYGFGGNDTIKGHGGNDVLDGGDGNNTLEGGTGNDTFMVSAGLDTIDETSGTDTIQYGDAPSRLR